MIFFIFIHLKFNFRKDLGGVLIATANAWGLFLVVVLLGYALVEIPKQLWKHSNRELTLKFYRFEIVNRRSEMDSARRDLDNVLKLIKKYSDKTKNSDPFRPYINEIIAKVKTRKI